MAETPRISIAVLTRKQDDVEIVNKSLRAAGYPVHCYWVKQSQLFARLLAERRLELNLVAADTLDKLDEVNRGFGDPDADFEVSHDLAVERDRDTLQPHSSAAQRFAGVGAGHELS